MAVRMDRRGALKSIVGGLTVAAGLGVAPDARAAEVLKVGTLAPAFSPWGQVLKVWAEAVSKKSNGTLELQFFFNGAQGDEAAMVGKMKDGHLDGGLLSTVGLSKIYKPILGLTLPGLVTTWAKLDTVRDAMKGELEKGAADAGFSVLGWGDMGAVHVMSKGFAVKTPDDVRGKKPYMWRDDDVAPLLFQLIGGVTPVPLNVPEVLPNLNTGTIDIVMVPALWAEQLQWSSKLDTIVSNAMGLSVGGIVLSKKRLAALSEENRNILLETGKIAANALTKRIRDEDGAAFDRLKGKMTVVELSNDEKAKWDGLFKQLRGRLRQGAFSAELMNKLEKLAQ